MQTIQKDHCEEKRKTVKFEIIKFVYSLKKAEHVCVWEEGRDDI